MTRKSTPGPGSAERIDAELARSALAKTRAGQAPTARESAALRRIEKAREERERWEHYRTVPQKHFREMCGRQTKQINEQAQRYGLPFGGPVVDLTQLLPALFNFLAENAAKLAADTPQTETALERQRAAAAELKEIELAERLGQLLPRDQVHELLLRLAMLVRGAGELLGRHHGADAQEILNEALGDYEAELEKFFAANDQTQ